MKINNSLINYYQEVSSDAPAPGGGSVCAYLIGLSIGLYLMSLRVSIKRKKFLELEEKIQNKVKNDIEQLEKINLDILTYVDKDIEVFNNFMKAYRSKEEQQILKETKNCFMSPYNVLLNLFKASDIMLDNYQYVVKSIKSDLKISLIMLDALYKATKENIEVNVINNDEELLKLKNEAYDKMAFYQNKISEVMNIL